MALQIMQGTHARSSNRDLFYRVRLSIDGGPHRPNRGLHKGFSAGVGSSVLRGSSTPVLRQIALRHFSETEGRIVATLQTTNSLPQSLFVGVTMLARSLLGTVLLVALTFTGTNANAHSDHIRRHYRPHYRTVTATAIPRKNILPRAATASHAITASNDQIVAHPAGCPRTLFCGCGAAQELGLSDPSLWSVKS